MSILFGILSNQAQPVTQCQLEDLAEATSQHAEDGTRLSTRPRVGMGFQPFYTHARSKFETQPLVDGQENMLCFDGRLDNHAELRKSLELADRNATDSEIVLAAYSHWGNRCFARLIGDWALALWLHGEDCLYLARDHAGTRTLYYESSKGRIRWGTYLETFLGAVDLCNLDEGFVARYLACQPIKEFTPYRDIRAVPPAHFVRIRDGRITIEPHWSWLIDERIRLHTEAEYEELFFARFKQAVERRTEPSAPILAQLSGGMDSGSMVCMSDHLRNEQGAAPCDLLDTVSYFDDSEPNWNEKPFFEAVERHRGKCGLHLPYPLLSPGIERAQVQCLWPGADQATLENERRLLNAMALNPSRVLLSGLGGDELLGGVPEPLPELGDLLTRGKGIRYLLRAVDWCLVDRRPLLEMSWQTLHFIQEQFRQPVIKRESLPCWVRPMLLKDLEESSRDRKAHPFDLTLRPSSIANARVGLSVLESLPVRPPRLLRRYEMRYPYLDRDLVEFLLRVPREVLLKPGRRRALMRSALRGLVPQVVLERRRKGSRSLSVLRTLKNSQQEILRLFRRTAQWTEGFVDLRRLESEAIQSIRRGDASNMPALLRAILFHLWVEAQHVRFNVGPQTTRCRA